MARTGSLAASPGAILLADGEFVGSRPTGREVRDLAAERDRLARTLDGLATAVFVTDADGAIIDANRAAAHMSGFEHVEDMLRTSSSEVLSRYPMPDADGGLLSDDQLPTRQVVLGEAPHGEVLMRVVDRVTGEEHWRMLRSTPLVEPDGQRLAVTSIEDVTVAKQAELRQGRTIGAIILLLYTDGVIDTPGQEERFGEPRLRDVAAAGPLDPAAVLERVDAATKAWQAGRAVDDRAMLALQLPPARDG